MLNLTKCIDFTQFLTQTNSESDSIDHLHTKFVQTQFNMGIIHRDNDHQSFWQLIDHSV